MKARLTNALRPWRWAWWLARPRRGPPDPAPGRPAPPHPPYYADMAQAPDRDYATKERRDG
jgi:hypothetical protein